MENSPKETNSSSNEFLIVPWACRSEWEEACNYFNSENYEELVVEISVWKERVESLPVGVEATLLLVLADLENKAMKKKLKSTSEVNVRSMYSLAIIRFINHVTHLAIKEFGDDSSASMFKLMSQVNIPDWIVNLRHEASHGTSLPSLETMLMAAQFCKEWLKNNYWLPKTDVTGVDIENTLEFFVNKPDLENSDEICDLSSCSSLMSAFIACRVYKLRGNDVVTDLEILQFLQDQSGPVNAKRAIFLLKNKLSSHLKKEPFEFCATAAEMMVPHKEFCTEITSLFNIENFFEQLLVIWKPVVDLLNTNGKLVSLCVHLANIHTLEDTGEHIQNLSALWLDNILEKLENSGKKIRHKLLPVLRDIMKNPNSHTPICLGRLLKYMKKSLGQEKVAQLKTLSAIWTNDNVKGKIKSSKTRKVSNRYFTIETLNSTLTGNNENAFSMACSPMGNWQLDNRGTMNFWRRISLGAVLNLTKLK